MNMLNDIDAMVKETLKNIEDGTVTPPTPDAPGVESVTLTVDGTPNGSKAKVIATVQPENAGVVSYKFEYKLSTEADYKLGEEISTSNKTCSYTYMDLSQEVVNNLKVTVTDHKGNSKDTTIDVTPDLAEPMNPNIDTTYGGLEVDYTPKSGQSYSTTQTVNGSSVEVSGYGNQTFSTSDLAAGWQVWGTDDNYIYIISTNSTSKELWIDSFTGYNNAVTLLDNICDNVYIDKTLYPGSGGQNLKLEQVLAVMSEAAKNNYANQYNTASNSYPATIAYPIIWTDHEQSNEDSQKNRSKKYRYVLPTAGTKQVGTSGYVSPYLTEWYNTNLNSSTYWKTGYNSTSYQALILNKARYFLSSRAVTSSSSNYCGFGLQSVYPDGVNTCKPYEYENGRVTSRVISLAIRPVVSFPRSMYELDTSTTPAKIVKK